MTHEELDIEAWLDNARAGLAPRAADQARVLAALEKRLALPSAQQTQQPSAAQRFNSVHSGSIELAAGGGRMLARWALRALLPIAGVGAAALIATQLHVSAPTPMPTLRPAQPAVAAVTELKVPELAAESDTRELVPADQADTQSDKLPAQKKKKPQRKKCRNGQEQPCESKPSETALAVAEPTSPPPAASLSRELEVLRQAQRALRSGQAAQALAVLETFEREANGGGEMQEERSAAATMARCALAQTEQDRDGLFNEFVGRYPKSAYTARLRRSCHAQP